MIEKAFGYEAVLLIVHQSFTFAVHTNFKG